MGNTFAEQFLKGSQTQDMSGPKRKPLSPFTRKKKKTKHMQNIAKPFQFNRPVRSALDCSSCCTCKNQHRTYHGIQNVMDFEDGWLLPHKPVAFRSAFTFVYSISGGFLISTHVSEPQQPTPCGGCRRSQFRSRTWLKASDSMAYHEKRPQPSDVK